MQNNNPLNNSFNAQQAQQQYDDMMARNLDASAMQQQGLGSTSGGGMGGGYNSYLPRLPTEEHLTISAVRQASSVPLRKRSLPYPTCAPQNLPPCPPLVPPHTRFLPNQPTPATGMFQMHQDATSSSFSRKRPHAANNSESMSSPEPSPSPTKKRALTNMDGNGYGEASISTALDITPEKTPVKVPPGKKGISAHAEDDVLSGRGGGTNSHPGNRFFRELINTHRYRYLRAKKNDKPHISRSIVNIIRSKKGRFLKKDDDDGLWYEIGDDLAREKTSQALRQKAPEHRRIAEEQDQRAREQFTAMSSSMPPMAMPHHHSQAAIPMNMGMGMNMGAASMMDRRMAMAAEMMDVPPPLPSHYDQTQMPMHPRGDPHSDELYLHYLNLKRKQAQLQREIALVKEIKQMKEQMSSMYQPPPPPR